MYSENIIVIVKDIVEKAAKISDRYVKAGKVNYACIFSHNLDEYRDLYDAVKKMGMVAKSTETGDLFKLNPPIKTCVGDLLILKVRKPDASKPQKGDADFNVDNYDEFKKRNMGRKNFSLITRQGFEMIEINDPREDVLVYFSSIPVIKQLGF
jgi:hypothetical protein